MRVALVHNPSAGAQVYSGADIAHLFGDAGYDVESFGKSDGDIDAASASGADVLVASGGDGTVAKAAIAALETGIPLYILPTGTSNNIARGMRVQGTVPVLAKALRDARLTRLDVGEVTAPWGTESFVEAAGVGFIGRMLRQSTSIWTRAIMRVRGLLPSTTDEAAQRAAGVARLIRTQPVRRIEVIVDGRDMTAEYLAVEVLNIPAIGPRVALAPGADAGDGFMDVAFVRAGNAARLAEEVASQSEAPAALEIHRARDVEMSWWPACGHVDDEPWPGSRVREQRARVRLRLRGHARVLVPSRE